MQHGATMLRREPASRVWVRRAIQIVPAVLALLLTAGSAAATTERVSVDSLGNQANAGSTVSSVSADGRFVAFASGAANLVAGDTNNVFDIFVHDRTSGATERMSVDSGGAQANAMSVAPAISADGRTVVFVSVATNLVAGDTNGRLDVFVHDRLTGATERMSVSSSGSQATSDSLSPWISGDGRRVVFSSAAGDLVGGDGNATFDIFVRDRDSATTLRVSVDSAGGEANGASLAPRMSADGLVVVFHSDATNLVAGDTNLVNDVFVHDLSTGVTERVSVGTGGTQGNLQSVAGSLSANGRFVAFDSDANNLVPGDTNTRTDVMVRDRVAGTIERASVAFDEAQANGQSGFVDPPSISADGRFVAFASGATNLVADDANNLVDVFVRDRLMGDTVRASVASDGTEGDRATALWPSLSANGSVVVFASLATNMVPDDTNLAQDVFAHANACGNGQLDVNEACDDGNVDDGDCCSSSCTVEADGSSCDDGDACTSGDACAAGVCVGGETDPEACLDPYECRGADTAWGTKSLRPGKLVLTDALGERSVFVSGPRALCSPVALSSEDEPLGDGTLLACHSFHDDAGKAACVNGKKLSVSNRYGVQKLSVQSSRRLCVAAGTDAVPAPDALGSFTCYGASTVYEHVGSKGKKSSSQGSSAKLPLAVAFCTPAALGDAEAVHPAAHLVCYLGSGKSSSSKGKHGWPLIKDVQHALGAERLAVFGVESHCVPSRLLDPPTTMGQGASSSLGLESMAHFSGSKPQCSSRSQR